MFTGEGLNLMKVSGSGTVFLANQAQDIHILELTGDGFTIDGKNVLAFETSLRWNIVRIDTQAADRRRRQLPGRADGSRAWWR